MAQRIMVDILEEILGVLLVIEKRTRPSVPITHFVITGDALMVAPNPGNTLVFTATPAPANYTPEPILASWSSSDTTNAPVVADTTTGFTATVDIPSTAAVGTSVTLTITYTNADGTVATASTSFTIEAAAPPVVDITGFTIAQTT